MTSWTVACQAPWDSPGKNSGMGCHSLLQGIFPTQGSNQGLLHCKQILYHLSHQGSPKLLQFSSVQSLSRVRLFATPWTVACQAPWDSPGKNPGVGSHFLLQGTFLTQESNLQLLRWQADSLPTELPGKPHQSFQGQLKSHLFEPFQSLQNYTSSSTELLSKRKDLGKEWREWGREMS